MFTLYLQEQGLYEKLKAGPFTRELVFELKLVLKLGGFDYNKQEFYDYAKVEFPGLFMVGLMVPEPDRIIHGLKQFAAEPWYQKAARVLLKDCSDKEAEDMHSMFDMVEKYWTSTIYNDIGIIRLIGESYSVQADVADEIGEVFTGKNASMPREGLMLKEESYQAGFYVLNIMWIADAYTSLEIIKDKPCRVDGGRPTGEILKFRGKITKDDLLARIFFLPVLKKETRRKDFKDKYPKLTYQTDFGTQHALPSVEDYLKVNGMDVDTFKKMTPDTYLKERADSYTNAVILRYMEKLFSK